MPDYIATAPDLAMAESGKEMQRLGLYAVQVSKTIQEAEDRVIFLKAQNEADAAFTDAALQYESRTDYPSFKQDSEDKATELMQQFEEQYGDKARVWRNLEPYIGRKQNQFTAAVAVKRLSLIGEEATEQVQIAKDSYAVKIAAEDEPDQREALYAEFEARIKGLEESHALPIGATRKAVKDLHVQSEKVEVIEGLRSNSIEEVEAMIARIDNHEFKFLDAEYGDWLASQKMTAENHIKALTEQQKVEKQKLVASAAIAQLKKENTNPDGTIDLVSAQRQLEDPKFQEEIGMLNKEGNPDAEIMAFTRTRLNALDAVQKQALKEVHDEYEKKIDEAFVAGDYDGVLALISAPNNPLLPGEGASWKNAIDSRIANDAKGAQGAYSIVDMIKINAMMAALWDPEPEGKPITSMDIRKFILQSNLDKEDREQKLGDLEAELKAQEKQGMSMGYRYIQDQILPELSLMGRTELMVENPEAIINILSESARGKLPYLRDANLELMGWVNKMKADGVDLSVGDIYNQATVIADKHYGIVIEAMKKARAKEKANAANK